MHGSGYRLYGSHQPEEWVRLALEGWKRVPCIINLVEPLSERKLHSRCCLQTDPRSTSIIVSMLQMKETALYVWSGRP